MNVFLLIVSLLVAATQGVERVNHKGFGETIARRIKQKWHQIEDEIHRRHNLKIHH